MGCRKMPTPYVPRSKTRLCFCSLSHGLKLQRVPEQFLPWQYKQNVTSLTIFGARQKTSGFGRRPILLASRSLEILTLKPMLTAHVMCKCLGRSLQKPSTKDSTGGGNIKICARARPASGTRHQHYTLQHQFDFLAILVQHLSNVPF